MIHVKNDDERALVIAASKPGVQHCRIVAYCILLRREHIGRLDDLVGMVDRTEILALQQFRTAKPPLHDV